MEQSQSERRLCALVAIDIAGYSRRAEADESAAIGLVAELSQLIRDTTGTLGGRVFNTAGDGFMLEFPTATGALTAAEAIVIAAPTAIRVGVHLGEVAVTEGGGLLGHGVNVAARLQQSADPGEIMVSDDVRRALRGPLADRLEAVGRMRLAKMKESRTVFSLKPSGPGRRRARSPTRWAAALAAAILGLAGAGFFAWRTAPRTTATDPLLVAVRSFDSGGADGPGASFGEAVADRLAATLADRQAPTVSRERTRKGDLGGARLLVGGGVERDGAVLRIRVQLDDAKSGLALWATSFERPATEGAALQNQAATNVAEVIAALREDLGADAKAVRPEVLAAYMKAVELSRRNRGSFEQSRQAYRRLVILAPQSSRVHSSLANTISVTLRLTKVPPDTAALWRKEAIAEAHRALELNPHNAEGYLALYDLTPERDYSARAAWVAKAKAADADAGGPMAIEGDFLKGVGRLQESITLVEQALNLEPNRSGRLAAAIFGLSGVGRYADAEALGARAARLMPDNNSVRRANLFTALLYAPPAKAAAAIDTFQQGEARLEPASEKAWRQFVAARGGQLAAQVAAKALATAPRAENGVDPSTAMSGFALLGRLDEAFAEAERARTQGLELHISSLFEPAAAGMRRDPRFMPLADRLGLVAYWRNTDHWPDFCQGPGLPLGCKAAAEAATRPEARKG